uniref:Phosphatidate cytidylyltransferase, mitochondrial n=1 Tax=Phallusia mammillata TaxID=59560 RepID=A0A6F9DVA2_9ASCI|nr:phosphatidate cytidylyltransferase, mitochondrial-like [Phallusia mammillata]
MRLNRVLQLMKTEVTLNGKESFYSRILKCFPGNMSLVFSYGSGVFPQTAGESPTSNMLDFVFVVDDAKKWHSENLQRNRTHYSAIMRNAGVERITNVMQNYGASVYYNTNIHMLGRTLKYGVVAKDCLVKDLTTWDKLYIAGRLHKPVHIAHHNFENSPELLAGLKTNLIGAVLTSLIILPETFSERELFETITGLSYMGDFRMTFGEDKKKVAKIVQSNYERFQQLYYPVLEGICETSFSQSPSSQSFIYWKRNSGIIDQDKSPTVQHNHLKRLPITVQLQVCRIFDIQAKHIRDVEEILKSVARYPDSADVVQQAVTNIVQRQSKGQSLKGILTAGPWTSIKYSANKIKKMVASMSFKRPVSKTI